MPHFMQSILPSMENSSLLSKFSRLPFLQEAKTLLRILESTPPEQVHNFGLSTYSPEWIDAGKYAFSFVPTLLRSNSKTMSTLHYPNLLFILRPFQPRINRGFISATDGFTFVYVTITDEGALQKSEPFRRQMLVMKNYAEWVSAT